MLLLLFFEVLLTCIGRIGSKAAYYFIFYYSIILLSDSSVWGSPGRTIEFREDASVSTFSVSVLSVSAFSVSAFSVFPFSVSAFSAGMVFVSSSTAFLTVYMVPSSSS